MNDHEKEQVISSEELGGWQGHRIAGKWVKTLGKGEEKVSINPSWGSPAFRFSTSKETVLFSVQKAHECFQKSKNLTIKDKAHILLGFSKALTERKDKLTRTLQIEAGKPLWEARQEVAAAIVYLQETADSCESVQEALLAPAYLGKKREDYSLEAIGPVIAYLPFSTPVISFVSYLSATVLSGNPIIFFSSLQSAATSHILASIDQGLDYPEGFFNLIFSGFEYFRQILNDQNIAAVIYSGSKENCDEIKKTARNSLKLLLECGGKNALIVHSSANIELAVQATLYGLCKSAGQLCSSTSRVFVYRSLMSEFKNLLVKALNQISIDVTDQRQDLVGPTMGPLYSLKAVEKFLRFQTMARREASEVLVHGKAIEHTSSQGFLVMPGVHLIENFDAHSPYQRNVLFSPDLALYPYDKLQSAIDSINTAYSLHAVAFIGDAVSFKDRRHLFNVANLILNGPTVEDTAMFPLAGRTSSSNHIYNGVSMALHLSMPQALIQPQNWVNLFANLFGHVK